MIIFIVPYRYRGGELLVFLSHMKYLLEDISFDELVNEMVENDCK